MGKKSGKNKKQESKPIENSNSPRAYDKDTVVFISMAQEHKQEGNKLFQKKDYEGAILKYEKALKLLPGNHIDVSHLRSNIAACYMQMGISDFPRAIHECNLALEVTPKYSKALLKRARCYEALNRIDLALRDVNVVLEMEPNNLMALEIEDRVKALVRNRLSEDEINALQIPDSHPKNEKKKKNKTMKKSKELEPIDGKKDEEIYKEKVKIGEDKKGKIKNNEGGKIEAKNVNGDKFEQRKGKIEIKMKNTDGGEIEVMNVNGVESEEKKVNVEAKKREKEGRKIEKTAEDKMVVEEEITHDDEVKRSVKLVYGEDIRLAKIPFNCDLLALREVVSDRFPVSRAVLIKYRDQEGDLVTITTDEELRWAESTTSCQNDSIRLYIVEVNPDQDPFFDHIRRLKQKRILSNSSDYIDDWILQFAQLFKNYVGFDSDSYLDLHEVGTKLYTEAMEDIVISEESQELFNLAADKFQEMAALALFNWGNVHLSRARKRVFFTEDSSKESILSQVKDSFEWAQIEYSKAGQRYEEAIKVKPDFYEGFLALGQQQFEQAKLYWYYALGTNVDLEKWKSTEAIQLYNKAEDNMEKGMQMWEEAEKVKMDSRANDVRSQINILWGTMLYERSIMEYKLGLPVWHECLEVAVEKFELAGASHTDLAVMIKSHCSNDTAPEGLGFDIDEIVQAWSEMYEAKRWQSGVQSFRLEPLLRRRVSKFFHALEHAR